MTNDSEQEQVFSSIKDIVIDILVKHFKKAFETASLPVPQDAFLIKCIDVFLVESEPSIGLSAIVESLLVNGEETKKLSLDKDTTNEILCEICSEMYPLIGSSYDSMDEYSSHYDEKLEEMQSKIKFKDINLKKAGFNFIQRQVDPDSWYEPEMFTIFSYLGVNYSWSSWSNSFEDMPPLDISRVYPKNVTITQCVEKDE